MRCRTTELNSVFPPEIVASIKNVMGSRPEYEEGLKEFSLAYEIAKERAEKEDHNQIRDLFKARSGLYVGSARKPFEIPDVESLLEKTKGFDGAFNQMIQMVQYGVMGSAHETGAVETVGDWIVRQMVMSSVLPTADGWLDTEESVASHEYEGVKCLTMPLDAQTLRILAYRTWRDRSSPACTKDFLRTIKHLWEEYPIVEGRVAIENDSMSYGGSDQRFKPTTMRVTGTNKPVSRLGRFYAKIGGVLVSDDTSDGHRVRFYRDRSAIKIHHPNWNSTKHISKVNLYVTD